MSAGDIIDRAVRLYRYNFFVLLRIVLAPSIVAFAGGILYTIGFRNISLVRGDARLVATGSMIALGILLMVIGKAAFYAVLGGASRSLVHHYFDGTPLRARDVYQAVRERLWSIIGATIILGLIAIFIAGVILFIVGFLFSIYAILAAFMIPSMPFWLQSTSHVIFGVFLIALIVILALLSYSRIVYVPQVLMVEGRSVFGSIGRSFSLAGGAVLRIAAIILFWFYVAWSLLLLLMIPLGWYAYWTGVDISLFTTEGPFWYNIVQQTLAQLSEILIAPIVMLGFTLLYLDSRVRKEGFDIELLANRFLSPPHERSHPEIIIESSGAPLRPDRLETVEVEQSNIEESPVTSQPAS